jgi:hypothetical protein
MADCKYCGKVAASDGSTIHEGTCAGLKNFDFTQLQHDFLADRIRELEAALREIEGCYDGRDLVEQRMLVIAQRVFATAETACTCDSTLVTDTSNHQPHCPRFKKETACDPDDAPINLDGFDKPGAMFKIGGKVVSREEGLAAFKARLCKIGLDGL